MMIKILNREHDLYRYILLIPIIAMGLAGIIASGGGAGGGGGSSGDPPEAPQNVQAVPADRQVTLSWDTIYNADGYYIYWNTSGGVDTGDSSISTAGTTYTHTGLTNGVTYYYRVEAYNSLGSALSAEVNATPSANILPTPSGLSVQSKNGHVSLDWTLVSGATSYDIYWNTTGGVTTSDDTINVSGPPTPTPPLTNGDRYYFMIIAKNISAESTPSSEISAIPGIQQLSSPDLDRGNSVAMDGNGYAYIAGETTDDFFVAKFNPNQLIWVQRDGSSQPDSSQGVAADAAGNSYIVGNTEGDLQGTNAGLTDIFIAKYDPDGIQVWLKQFGTSQNDKGEGVALDASGNVYVSGYTTGDLDGTNAGLSDVFVAKFDADGNQQWLKQFGSSQLDSSRGIAVSAAGTSYLVGDSEGDLGGTNAGHQDIFIAKYDTDGNQQWLKQFGTSALDWGEGVALDTSGNVYVSGATNGDLNGTNAGNHDVFVAKFDTDGNQQWLKQFGTSESDYSEAVALDASGNVYVSGYTYGDLIGTNAGYSDIFIVKYSTDGNQQWLKQFGTSEHEGGAGIVANTNLALLYVSGWTSGNLDTDLGDNPSGYLDAFLSTSAP